MCNHSSLTNLRILLLRDSVVLIKNELNGKLEDWDSHPNSPPYSPEGRTREKNQRVQFRLYGKKNFLTLKAVQKGNGLHAKGMGSPLTRGLGTNAVYCSGRFW